MVKKCFTALLTVGYCTLHLFQGPTGCAIKIRHLCYDSLNASSYAISDFNPDSNSCIFILSDEVSFFAEVFSKGGQNSQNVKLVTQGSAK